ncbi:hypothetical protein GCM10020219_055760 [Nonomuraea dietziae]
MLLTVPTMRQSSDWSASAPVRQREARLPLGEPCGSGPSTPMERGLCAFVAAEVRRHDLEEEQRGHSHQKEQAAAALPADGQHAAARHQAAAAPAAARPGARSSDVLHLRGVELGVVVELHASALPS